MCLDSMQMCFDYVQHVHTVDIKYMCLIVNVSCATVGWSSP